MTTQEALFAKRWQQVVSRDPKASFIYGVHSTKIYCRPSCPARLARRAGVSFFNSASEAETAGFRACKRCRPKEAAPETPEQVLARVCARIESCVTQGKDVRLVDLAGTAGWSSWHLLRRFKGAIGVTPRVYALEYAQKVRECERIDLMGAIEVDSPAAEVVGSVESKEIVDQEGLGDCPVELFDFTDWVDWESELMLPSQVCMPASNSQLEKKPKQLLRSEQRQALKNGPARSKTL